MTKTWWCTFLTHRVDIVVLFFEDCVYKSVFSTSEWREENEQRITSNAAGQSQLRLTDLAQSRNYDIQL